jgi:hypothetical protein
MMVSVEKPEYPEENRCNLHETLWMGPKQETERMQNFLSEGLPLT